MTDPVSFPRNVPFRPSPAFIPWFIINFLFFLLLIAAFAVLPFVLATEVELFISLVILGGLVLITILFVIWVRLYYDTMAYELHDDELRWRRGVWFRTTGIVPYNRITNLDLKQGPVMRWLGISTIAIQTAGYSGQAAPEIRIEAIEHADELRELLRNAVRSCSGGGDGTGTGAPARVPDEPVASTGTSMLILNELKKIRILLERQQEK